MDTMNQARKNPPKNMIWTVKAPKMIILGLGLTQKNRIKREHCVYLNKGWRIKINVWNKKIRNWKRLVIRKYILKKTYKDLKKIKFATKEFNQLKDVEYVCSLMYCCSESA